MPLWRKHRQRIWLKCRDEAWKTQYRGWGWTYSGRMVTNIRKALDSYTNKRREGERKRKKGRGRENTVYWQASIIEGDICNAREFTVLHRGCQVGAKLWAIAFIQCEFISSLKSNNNKYIRGISGSEHSLAYSQARIQDKQRQISEAGIKQPVSQMCTELKNLN